MEEQLAKTLAEAGWTEDREVEIETYITAFEEEKIECPPSVLEFLKSYGGLTLAEKSYSPLHFSPIEALKKGSMKNIKEYERIAGCSLCPVGDRDNRSVLFMDDDKRLYAAFDKFFHCYGDLEMALTGLTRR